MAQLTVRKVDPEIVRRLKLRAAQHGRSAEAEHRAILERLLGTGADDFWAKAEKLRAHPWPAAHRQRRPDPRGPGPARRSRRMIEAAVVDASVAVKWVIGEAGEDAAVRLATRSLSAPDILLAECASALWAKVRRREIVEAEAEAALAALGDAPVVMTAVPALVADALRLGLLLGHPIYHCLYLALSLQTRTPLVTADRRFAAAVARHAEVAAHVLWLEDAV
jgi:predicted nucleic acid-binding protein